MGEAERKVKHLDDSKIVELFFERSEQAIIELSKKYGPLCGKIAFNILNSVDDEEECVNDAFLAVWNAIPPQRPEHLGSYVCRVVRNLALKKYHSNTASKRNGEYDVALDEIEEFIPSPSSVEDELDARELAAMYNVCARVFEESGTCRENLNPETASGRDFKCGVDFCGWAALAPVAIPAEFGWLGKQAPSR